MCDLRLRYLVVALFLGATAAACFRQTTIADPVAPSEPAKRPNIILIMADDVGYECFGCYGSRQYATPNIDRLATQGIRFTHCYAQPLCTPSRVKLMTGLSNARNYSAFSVLNRDQRAIGHYLRDAGYATAVAGKWQLLGAEHYPERFRGKGTWPRDAGFDHVCLWQVDELGERYWGPRLYIDGENRQFGEGAYGPDVVTDYLSEFLDNHRDESFFVYYPMILTHNPFVPTPFCKDRNRKDRQKNFEAMVTYADSLVGRIVRRVEESGIADRTLVLFTSDNGTHRAIRSTLDGREIRGGKGTTTDAGTHVPLVAYWPKTVPAGRTCTDLVDFSDFLPTILEASGIPLPEQLDGRSFLPQLLGRPGNPRAWLYCYYCPRPEKTRPIRFVRDRRYKLYGNGQFFDLQTDPLERSPLAEVRADSPAGVARQKLAAALETLPAEGQTLLRFGSIGE